MSFYIIIRGPLGCGKSTIAKNLAENLKAKVFSIDDALEANNLDKEIEDGYISQNSFKKVNEILAPQARDILIKGQPVIFDGNFYWPSALEDLIARLDFPHYVFTLTAPLEICRARDAGRPRSAGSAAVEAVYAKVAEFDFGIVIDVNEPLSECLNEIFSYL